MKLYRYTGLIMGLNTVVDTGKHNGITIAEIEEKIESKTIFEYLENIIQNKWFLSSYTNEEKTELQDQLFDIYINYCGQEDKRWQVKNNGICLLIAWVAEIIQRGHFSK